jgi:serine/threonine kinase 33
MRRSFSSNTHDPNTTRVIHARLEHIDTLMDLYSRGAELGHGAFGVVHEFISKETGESFACKTIEKEKAGSTGVRMLEIEIGVLKRVDHPNIVMLSAVYETPQRMYLVMELCSGGSLSDWALTVSGQPAYAHDQVATIIRRVSGAVAYLHDCGIIHRDLKLDNIMLKSKRSLDVKICDFGLAAVHNKDSQVQMVCGTESYMAPEVIASKSNYSPLCDVWSIGVILYLLLSGSLPFRKQGSDDHQLAAIKRTKIDYVAPIWGLVDKRVKSLLLRLLNIDPAARMSAKELVDNGWVSGKPATIGGDKGGHSDSMTVIEMMKLFAAEQAEEERLEGEAQARLHAASAAAMGGFMPVSNDLGGPPTSRASVPTYGCGSTSGYSGSGGTTNEQQRPRTTHGSGGGRSSTHAYSPGLNGSHGSQMLKTGFRGGEPMSRYGARFWWCDMHVRLRGCSSLARTATGLKSTCIWSNILQLLWPFSYHHHHTLCPTTVGT